jgi:ABC-type lipoprotein release transport system permease subunit
MLSIKLAIRNLLGTGLRFWLNCLVIALSVTVIIFARGLYAGLTQQLLDAVISTETGVGQCQAKSLDPLDPITFDKGKSLLTAELQQVISAEKAAVILFHPATLYTKGRALPVVLRGINQEQTTLTIPSHNLAETTDTFPPVIIGRNMAKYLRAKQGDIVTIKWRDQNGVFDAIDFRIKEIFSTINPRVDNNIIWLSLPQLQKMCEQKNFASIVVFPHQNTYNKLSTTTSKDWKYKDQVQLVDWMMALIRSDESWMRLIFVLLLFLSGIGIFNAQILSVFKRQREIGVLMALGMRSEQVVRLFTLEGIITTLFGFLGTAIFGTPILLYIAHIGIPVDHAEGLGVPIPEFLTPHYTNSVILTTLLFVLVLMTFVSWWPTRRISRMEPARAIRGRGL